MPPSPSQSPPPRKGALPFRSRQPIIPFCSFWMRIQIPARRLVLLQPLLLHRPPAHRLVLLLPLLLHRLPAHRLVLLLPLLLHRTPARRPFTDIGIGTKALLTRPPFAARRSGRVRSQLRPATEPNADAKFRSDNGACSRPANPRKL